VAKGFDRWGRPIVVLDNSVENTNSIADQMLFLAWNLESTMQEMPSTVDKFCLFIVCPALSPRPSPHRLPSLRLSLSLSVVCVSVSLYISPYLCLYVFGSPSLQHLDRFSLWNVPPLAATKETIDLVSKCYPERLGHAIIFQVCSPLEHNLTHSS
jgi:hypothetical protein